MKEIKFRMWDKKRLKFWFWGFLEDGIFTGITTGSSFTLSEAKESSEQFSGLCTDYGNDIYAGDIIDEKYKYKVFFQNGAFLCKSNLTTTGTMTLGQLLNKRRGAGVPCKKIGNIHENPELLKNET